ncbi:MAG: TIM barrel protein [Phycisphaerae bacterium]|nr:TIM barrel protein [Phycisphaerae bacterium]
MKLGFMAWCFPSLDLDRVLAWAVERRFECVILDRWPWDLAEAKDLLARYDLSVTALGTSVNILDPDPAKQKDNVALVKKIIAHAEKLNVPTVEMFAGRNPNTRVEDNYAPFKKVMTPLVKFAADRGRRISVENCPMMHDSWPGGTNIAYSPAIWERMFDLVPAENFGLTFDPAHCVWLGIDYLAAVRAFGDRIFGVHAKDCEILHEVLAVAGILGDHWWRYRMPGWGEVDWPAFLSALHEVGFAGDLNLEHEDVLFGFDDLPNSPEKVKQGLLLGQKFLKPYLPDPI